MTAATQHIVVAYSLSAGGTLALEHAVELARRSPGRALHVVHAIDAHAGTSLVPRDGRPDYHYADAVQAAIGDIVKSVLTVRPAPHEIHVDIHARFGKPAEEILAVAGELGADLILVGSHDRTGLERMLLGSTSATVVRQAACPVLVIRPKTYHAADLLDVVDDDHPHHRYTPPHRYVYRDDRVLKRPADWPIL
jgi:nucleotide-binding universal stress UspA family protein